MVDFVFLLIVTVLLLRCGFSYFKDAFQRESPYAKFNRTSFSDRVLDFTAGVFCVAWGLYFVIALIGAVK